VTFKQLIGPRVLKVALFTVWAAICAAALVEMVPDSPFAYGIRARGNLISVLPQGWSFFTRNAREERLLLYEPRDGGWRLRPLTNAQVRHLWGIKRTAGLISAELGAITRQIPEKAWTTLESNLNAGSYSGHVPIKVENPGVAHVLCGTFLLRKQVPLPWAWAASPRLSDLPSRVALVDVGCKS
jgi:antimicrobial peptide system SdpA family protein